MVGRPDDTTGEAVVAFVVLKRSRPVGDEAKAIAKAKAIANEIAKAIAIEIAKAKAIANTIAISLKNRSLKADINLASFSFLSVSSPKNREKCWLLDFY